MNQGEHDAFMSPVQTPQGSPSKRQMPPGAFDLPDVFSNAMKLIPTIGSTNNKGPKQVLPTSPSKLNIQDQQDPFQDPRPSSPSRISNKENTSPSRPNLQKDTSYISHAAASRQDPYRTQAQDGTRPASPTRQKLAPSPTQAEMEKLAKPAVKRLANVTQLCRSRRYKQSLVLLTRSRLPRPLLRPSQLCSHPTKAHGHIQGTQPAATCDERRRISSQSAAIPWSRKSKAA